MAKSRPQRMLMVSCVLALVGCGGSINGVGDGGGSDVGAVDGGWRDAEPPEHIGCLGDELWQMDYVGELGNGEASDVRAYPDPDGGLMVVQHGRGDEVLSIFRSEGDGTFGRTALVQDQVDGLGGAATEARAQVGLADGRLLVFLIGLSGSDASSISASWNGHEWTFEGAAVVQNVPTPTVLCGLSARTDVRNVVWFPGEVFNEERGVREQHLFSFGVDGISDLGLAPEGYRSCQSTERGLRVVRNVAAGEGEYPGPMEVMEPGDAPGEWRKVGEFGMTNEIVAARGAPLYDVPGGLRLFSVAAVPPPDAMPGYPADQSTLLLNDLAVDGEDIENQVDHLGWSSFPDTYTVTRVAQLHSVVDVGGITHVVYERGGEEGICFGCGNPPDIEGLYGLRYAVRTDGGWVRKDLLWQTTMPALGYQALDIWDIVTWEGSVHILVSLRDSVPGGMPFFTFQSGDPQHTRPGIYDVHASGCASR